MEIQVIEKINGRINRVTASHVLLGLKMKKDRGELIGDVLMEKTFTIDPISHKRLSNLEEGMILKGVNDE